MIPERENQTAAYQNAERKTFAVHKNVTMSRKRESELGTLRRNYFLSLEKI